MSDLISKSALLNRIATEVHYDTENPLEQYGKLMWAICSEPTIDAEPVRHGHWFTIGYMVDAQCSECRKWIDVLQGDAEMNYCPHCGAKMDGGDIE